MNTLLGELLGLEIAFNNTISSDTLIETPIEKGEILIPKKLLEGTCAEQPLLKRNYLSEFFTKSEKEKVLKNLGINTSVEWGEIGGFVENQSDLAELLKGGLCSVANIKERDLIPEYRRKEGMLCYVASVDKYYQLKNNGAWEKANLSGSGIIQVNSYSDLETLTNIEIGQIVYVKEDSSFLYLKDTNTWGIINNIVVSEEEPVSTDSLWIDPTGDSEINKEGNLTNIRLSLKTLRELMDLVIKIIQYGAIAGDSSIGGRTGIMSSATPINPNPDSEDEEETTEIEPTHLTYTVPNISVKVDTLENFSKNYRNLLNGELIWISDKQSLYIYINGKFVAISNGSDVPTPEDMTQDDIEKLYFNHLGFTNSKEEQYRMEVNDNGNIIVYNTANYDGSIGNKGTYGSYISDYLRINSIFLGGANTKLDSFSACTHNYVELANGSTEDINLNGIYLLYRAPGVSDWTSLELRGIIKAGSTFLIRGARCSYKSNVTLDANTYDLLWKVNDKLIEFDSGGGCFYLVCSDGGKFYKGTELVTLSELSGYEPYSSTGAPTGYIDLVGIKNPTTTETVPSEGNSPIGITNTEEVKDCIFVRSFSLDPCSQAQKTNDKKKSSTLWTYINMSTKGKEGFPYYSDKDKQLYVPKASILSKNIFDTRSTFDSTKPNLLNITFGIQATDSGSGATRCFNWISVGYYDEYIEYKLSSKSWDDATKVYSIDNNNTYTNSKIETFKNIYSRIKWVTTNGTAVTSHKAIVWGLTAGTYDVRVRRDGDENYIGDTLHFTVRNDAAVSSGFTFVQTTDQQAFNFYEYQAWTKAAYAIKKNHPNFQFTINTGDMTQNGNRESEWIDYYNGRQALAGTEDMVTIGNNDLCGITPYELGDGTAATYKINHKNIQYYYCFELDENNPPIFTYQHNDKIDETLLGDVLSYDETSFTYYMPSVYSFNYGLYHFICLNSEFAANTYKCYYNDTALANDIFKSHAYYNMYRWLVADCKTATLKYKIAYMHEIPLCITAIKSSSDVTASARTATNGSKLNNDFSAGVAHTLLDTSDSNNYKGGCCFSEFFLNNSIKLCLGGHKHTYSLSYPTKESIVTTDDTRTVNYNTPTVDKTGSDGVVYAMCQATGYKLVSNKELPGSGIDWLKVYFPATSTGTTAKASASQYYPMYSVFDATTSSVTMNSYIVLNIYSGTTAFNINNLYPDFLSVNSKVIENTNRTITY